MPNDLEGAKNNYISEKNNNKNKTLQKYVLVNDIQVNINELDNSELEAHKLLGNIKVKFNDEESEAEVERDELFYQAELDLVSKLMIDNAPPNSRQDTVMGEDNKIIWLNELEQEIAQKIRDIVGPEQIVTRWYYGFLLKHESSGKKRLILKLPEQLESLYDIIEAELLPGRLVKE